MQLLPTEILDWVNPKDFNADTFINDIPVGCFLEVDVGYPDELHDLHNDYPLVGKKAKVKEEMLSEYQLQIIENNRFSLGKSKKITPKTKYKLHYQNLKLYSNLGLQMKKSIEH